MTRDSAKTENPQIEICCRIDSSMLGLLREFVTSVARHIGFSEKETSEIEICVDEACANALEHAYTNAIDASHPCRHKELYIEISFANSELTVRVIDHGRGSEKKIESRFRGIEDYMEPGRPEYRGLGLYLMHKFMDRVDVRSAPGKGTTVEMTKIRK
jgi:anti-sigma regulatory factor (Ser/Thr protein kinase)